MYHWLQIYLNSLRLVESKSKKGVKSMMVAAESTTVRDDSLRIMAKSCIIHLIIRFHSTGMARKYQ